jgi:hypothetical protein
MTMIMRRLILTAFVIAVVQFMSYSQDIETRNDSLSFIKNDSLFLLLDSQRVVSEKIPLPELEIKELLSPSLLDSPNALDIKLNPALTPSTYYDSEYLTVFPLSYHFYNGMEGGTLMGVNNHFQLSESFWADLSVMATSSFVGYLQPDPYNNGSVSLMMKWQVHDRVRLFSFGQLSLREGINPALSPLINSGYNYGGGVEFRIAKKFALGIGFTNSYYRKNWTLSPFVGPVSW